ncbi:PaaI family thioesterase [Halopenitus persicus]|uniref:Acyl-CoA thioesterase n=1 Tax=Halopenitus persicus TaxID=1048396 RepID=A0A1H3HKR6_9EURY|nr:PaaI family thioesterase [Halopenitus persicus]SDY16032.1 acyl-CoA thioesterase [Halopenitus persicus]
MANGSDHSAEDAFCETLGIVFEEVSEGSAVATMTITDEHLNFGGVLHGGAAFSLADAAAGAAMQSVLEEDISTALEANISFLSAVDPGEEVVAKAEVTHKSRKTGEVTVSLETEEGEPVGSYRARAYRIT